jgi:hypothetical protein
MLKVFVDTAAWIALLNANNELRRLAILQIIPASQELLTAGWTLYSQRPDKEWSLTDCTSFAAMKQEQLAQAFTSDHHFEQAGFVKLLPHSRQTSSYLRFA